jgi:hypothetical protein
MDGRNSRVWERNLHQTKATASKKWPYASPNLEGGRDMNFRPPGTVYVMSRRLPVTISERYI